MLDSERIEANAGGIEQNKDNRKMYDHVKLLRKSGYKDLILKDEDRHIIRNKVKIIKTIDECYKNFFNGASATNLEQWNGLTRPLHSPITEGEVKTAVKRLKKNKAVGPDGLPAGYFKHAGKLIQEEVSTLLNKIFKQHNQLENDTGRMFISLNRQTYKTILHTLTHFHKNCQQNTNLMLARSSKE